MNIEGHDNSEVSLVQDWLYHRSSVTKDDPWGALFGEEEEARTLEVRHHLSRNITNALRVVSGDPAIRIHHMRHGAGTSAISLALSSNRRSALAVNGAEWFLIKDKTDAAKEFIGFHLGHSPPTRRIIWAISQGLGHTSPRTTVWHYGHSLDLALHEHVCQLSLLKNADVSRYSGMNQNLLNVTFHKSKNRSADRVALLWLLRDQKENVLESQVEDQPFSNDAPMSSPAIQFLTSTKLAHFILTDIYNEFGMARVAGRYAREEAEVKALVDAAAQVEKLTGYRAYRQENNALLLRERDKLSKLMTGHAIQLIPKFKEAFENPKKLPILKRGIDAWARCYEPIQSGLRVPHEDDLEAIVVMLEILGFEKGQIILAGNSSVDIAEMVKKSHATLDDAKIVTRSATYRSSRRTRSGTIKSPTLLVSHSSKNDGMGDQKTGQSLSMTKLNHQFFLGAVLLFAQEKF